MSFELEIVNMIKAEEKALTKIEYKKKTAQRISEEKEAYIAIEQKKYYMKGLRDALTCIQKKRD